MLNCKKKKNKGYTLIEVLVAMTIFSLVIASPTGFFVSSLRGQQKALASQEMVDSMSYALEYISKSLRMAQKDTYGSCLGEDKLNYAYTTTTDPYGIRFINSVGDCQYFFIQNNILKEQKDGEQGSNNLTPENLEIVSFKIEGSGWSQIDDETQPKVTLFFEVIGKTGGTPETQPKIKLQTTVSQRNLNVNY